MVKAQEWLNKKYPNKKETKEIFWGGLEKIDQESELVIDNFPNLVKIASGGYSFYKIKKVTISNCSQLKEVNVDWFIDNEELKINNCPNITKLRCNDNKLTSFDFASLNPKTLIEIDISDNNFHPQDLSCFTPFINLEKLSIGVYPEERITLTNNHFYGSLKPLKGLTELKKLNISETDISSGLEYLPPNLEGFHFCSWIHNKTEVMKIEKTLEIYGKDTTGYFLSNNHANNFSVWRRTQPAFQLLLSYWKKFNPHLDIWEILHKHKIFFNVKTGTFEGDTETLINFLQQTGLIDEKDKDINFLKRMINELKVSRKDLILKINDDYLSFPFSEKELLRKLITSRLELTNLQKTAEMRDGSINDRTEEIYKMCGILGSKLPKMAGKIDNILTNCSELVMKELELQNKLNVVIEVDYKKKEAKNITYENFGIDNDKTRLKITELTKLLTEVSSDVNFYQAQIKPHLEYFIGKGCYGEVYYGKWKSQEVAVKKLSLHNLTESDFKDIQKEINILKNLRNRHIIQYYGTYSDEQELLIIMDYAENETLTKFINENKGKEHNWKLNSEFIRQITLGLVYIHSEGIIHRDLKSMNILLVHGYQVKISDFGLSKIKTISSSQSSDAKGTVRWMAPEVIEKQKYSEQSDIYSLGMIIWEIAAKCTIPFKDIENNYSVMFQIVSKNKRENIPNDTPENVRDIIEQCWKSNPSERITLSNILEKAGGDNLLEPIAQVQQPPK